MSKCRIEVDRTITEELKKVLLQDKTLPKGKVTFAIEHLVEEYMEDLIRHLKAINKLT